ncbi:MAG TPA: carbohydrate ABC transporter permease [bacterium]|nr:carbohydrate ABC transporter permease [bacterium]HOL55170.1 carbohydrate ABC transporter permease [bacterium]HOP56047.1 carbohydrate ABC transporter permease [bacterium]HPC77464.1 carbohydrate ABC transporter permease [bacterium]HPO82243.1 carbohydrate ABC transporter permease [bacterium]
MFSLKRREIFRQQVTFNIILAVLAIVVAFPIFWTICSSFKTIQEIYTLNPKILPKSLDFVNYKFLFETSVIDYKQAIINSIVVSITTVVIVVICSALGGYGFSRINFKYRDNIFNTIVMLQFVPLTAGIIAQWQIMSLLNLRDSLIGLALLLAAIILPPNLVLMRQSFLSVPTELEDAAKIDGASTFQLLWHVMLPLAGGGLILVAVNSFLFTWGDFIYARTMLTIPSKYTMPVIITVSIPTTPATLRIATYGVYNAAAMITAIPAIIFFILIQNRFYEGAREGLKG